MKRKEMQEMLQQYKLPTTGTEQILRERLKMFHVMWSAETDSINPKTPSQLSRELQSLEKAKAEEKLHERFNGASNHGAYLKKIYSDGQSGNDEFDKNFKEGFSALIQQAKERKNLKHMKAISADVALDGGNDGFSAGELCAENSSVKRRSDQEGTTSQSAKHAKLVSVAMNKENDSLASSTPVSTSKNTSEIKKPESSSKPASRSSSIGPALTTPSSHMGPFQATSKSNSKMDSRTKRSPHSSMNDAASSRGASLRPRASWTCTACTFENVPPVSPQFVCEMCGSNRERR
mmetsp:Transcript_15511/g.27951  ORF Transcript_15511/g.27951 Transcript_15511/m.27951 type:complete len:291 (+) Transcript_15511:3-875(+)